MCRVMWGHMLRGHMRHYYTSAEDFVKKHSNISIRADKSIDKAVIGVEALERWKQLKIYGISLARYFGERKIELFSQEIESFIVIKLKTTPR